MSRFNGMRALALAALMALAMGCNSDDNGVQDAGIPDTGPLPYGEPCKVDDECDSKMCIDGFCSKLCKAQTDCAPKRVDPDPKKAKGSLGGPCRDNGACAPGLRCVGGECLRQFACGLAKEKTVACYPTKYDEQPFTGAHDCSQDGRCANTYRCMGLAGSSDRYCAAKCKEDKDCPPRYRCATFVRNTTPTDSDTKEDTRCMRRELGHPCVTDDQCGSERLCAKDTNGNGFCTKTCKKGEAGTCPKYMKCEDVGNNKLACRHLAGFTYKPGGAGHCEPCIHHDQQERDVTYYEKGGCANNGRCLLLDRYSGETACLVTTCKTETNPSPPPADRLVCPEPDPTGKFEWRCLTAKPNYCVPTRLTSAGRTIGTCQPL